MRRVLFLLIRGTTQRRRMTNTRRTRTLYAKLRNHISILQPGTINRRLGKLTILYPIKRDVRLPRLFILPLRLTSTNLNLLTNNDIQIRHTLTPNNIRGRNTTITIIRGVPTRLRSTQSVRYPNGSNHITLTTTLYHSSTGSRTKKRTRRINKRRPLYHGSRQIVRHRPRTKTINSSISSPTTYIRSVRATRLRMKIVLRINRLINMTLTRLVRNHYHAGTYVSTRTRLIRRTLIIRRRTLRLRSNLFTKYNAIYRKFRLILHHTSNVNRRLRLPKQFGKTRNHNLRVILRATRLPRRGTKEDTKAFVRFRIQSPPTGTQLPT